MRERLDQFAAVTAYSPRILVAIVAALVMPIAILFMGAYATDTFSFEGPLAPLTSPIREFLFHRYLEVAALSFLGCGAVARKEYRRAALRLMML